jgi:hypothetical protein
MFLVFGQCELLQMYSNLGKNLVKSSYFEKSACWL